MRKASHDLEGLALFFLYEIAIFCLTSHRQLGALHTSRPPACLLLYPHTNPTEFTEILKPKSKNAVFGMLARRMSKLPCKVTSLAGDFLPHSTSSAGSVSVSGTLPLLRPLELLVWSQGHSVKPTEFGNMAIKRANVPSSGWAAP